MENNFRNTDVSRIEYATVVGENKLLRSSFSWMALAMLLTSLAAILFSSVPELTSLLFIPGEFGGLRPTTLSYVVMFAPLAFILVLNFGIQRLSFPAMIGIFIALSFVMGVSLSTIFFVYSMESIAVVFLSTTGLFATMAIAGYTTKTDLTKLGSILMIGLIGIVIASLINLFMGSPSVNYVISILGVIIFTGLTAYDVQKLKLLGQQVGGDSQMARKLGIMGALTLYLDFINLFMFLLRLFGGRRD